MNILDSNTSPTSTVKVLGYEWCLLQNIPTQYTGYVYIDSSAGTLVLCRLEETKSTIFPKEIKRIPVQASSLYSFGELR